MPFLFTSRQGPGRTPDTAQAEHAATRAAISGGARRMRKAGTEAVALAFRPEGTFT